MFYVKAVLLLSQSSAKMKNANNSLNSNYYASHSIKHCAVGYAAPCDV